MIRREMASEPAEEAKPQDRDNEPVRPDPLSRRESALADINRSREVSLAENGIDTSSFEGDDHPEPSAPESTLADSEDGRGDQPDALEPSEVSADPPASDPPASDPEKQEETVEVVVYGEKKTVPLSQVIDSYQTQEAAETRLRQANELYTNAKNISQDPDQGDGDGEVVDQPPADKPLDSVNWTELAEQVQFQDAETAGEALKNAVQTAVGSASEPLDQQAVVDAVREQTEFSTAAAGFVTEFSDLFEDPNLQIIAGAGLKAALEATMAGIRDGQTRPPYVDIFRAVGDSVRAWRGDISGDGGGGEDPNEPSNEPDVDIAARIEAKRSSSPPVAPRTGGAGGPPAPSNATAPSAMPTPEDRSKVISEMAESRGQATP